MPSHPSPAHPPVHRSPSRHTGTDLISHLSRLSPRDQTLLTWLADHQVLTTPQIAASLFTTTRACQKRLHTLHTIGFLHRFRWRRPGGGSLPWHWTLGPLGHALHAAATAQQPPTARQLTDRLHRLAANPRLTHLLGVNQFFIDLITHTRNHPDTALDRWWPERTTTNTFLGIHPDGHGLWTAAGTTVGWFLEYDTGTESLTRVVKKMETYDKLIRSGGPRYPVLFRLPTTERETHLHQRLAHRTGPTPVATSVHNTPPAGPVWALVGASRQGRLALVDLPSDHGPDTVYNPTWTDGRLQQRAVAPQEPDTTSAKARCQIQWI